MATLPDELRDLRMRQGHAWIDRLADLEGWPDHERSHHHEALRTTPLQAIEAVADQWRARMWQAMERTGQVPVHQRKRPRGDAAPPEPRPRKPKGLAKHLTPKGKPSQPGQRELFNRKD